MAEKIRLAIVGCGGMGHRHMAGLQELHRHGLSHLDLVAACDPVTENARSLAQAAAACWDQAPAVVARLDQLPALGVQAIDLTSPPALHHTIIEEALAAGIHVMTEKPLGLTVAASQRICQAAAQSDCIVSVAENYRRDPINRLARAVLDAGAIGEHRLMLMNDIGGRDRMLITLWRHMKKLGGILVDMGVHYGDIMEYFMGPVVSVYGQKRLHETIRRNPRHMTDTGVLHNPGGAYAQWQARMPETFEPDAEDALYGTLVFANGATAQFSEDHAGWGLGHWQRTLYGSRGSMELPRDRSGQPLTVHLGAAEAVEGKQVLDLVPDFTLDPVTAALFGGERLGSYAMEFTEIDRKLLAVEYAEFAGAIRGENEIEVDAWQGTRAVAVIYALLESAEAGRVVTMDEILKGELDTYQAEINADMKLSTGTAPAGP